MTAQDSVLRVEKNTNYKTVNLYAVANDDDLSAKACGILWYLVSRPDGWKFYKSDVIKRFSDGRASIDSGFEELKERGYLSIERNQSEDGTFDGWVWTIRETPVDRDRDDRMSENPTFGKSTPSNKDNTNKEISKPHNGDSENEVDWQELTPAQRLAKSTPSSPSPRIAEVFQYVREARAEAVDKQVGPPLQLTQKRHNKIRARLKEGWEVGHLKKAYEGCLNDEWHAEKQKFDIEYVFRDDEKVRDFLRRYDDQNNSSSNSNLIESDKEEYLN